jgi:hypothetical protein
VRARWKIENEHNNVLKNHGYHFEHNFGHGGNHAGGMYCLFAVGSNTPPFRAVKIGNINKKLVVDDSTLRVEFGVSQKQAYGLRETPEIKRKALDPISLRNEPRK